MTYYALWHYPENEADGTLIAISTDIDTLSIPDEFSKPIGFNSNEDHPEAHVIEIFYDRNVPEMVPLDPDGLYTLIREMGSSDDEEPYGRSVERIR